MSTIDEIAALHGAQQVCPHGAGFYFLLPDHCSIVYSAEEGPVASVLGQLLEGLMVARDVVDLYVRERKADPWEPMRGWAPIDGQWLAVTRPRVPGFRCVGIMLAKDEADAIPEVVASLQPALDCLYYRSGDPATAEALAQYAPWARAVPGTIASDGCRQPLLERARADARADGDTRPMWVIVAQGDEVYHDSLRRAVEQAHAERATVMSCQVATFLLHESQRDWPASRWREPLARRMTHYICDFGEHVGFLDFPWIRYDERDHMRAHPRRMFPGKWYTKQPVRKHYPFRSPDQARARIEDRLKSGWQPHYEHYKAVFMSGEAAGREILWFGGDFPTMGRRQ